MFLTRRIYTSDKLWSQVFHVLGTSNVLMVFDESEVRKIVAECKKVLDYLSISEVIETLEDLVQFVQDLSPCLTRVRKLFLDVHA